MSIIYKAEVKRYWLNKTHCYCVITSENTGPVVTDSYTTQICDMPDGTFYQNKPIELKFRGLNKELIHANNEHTFFQFTEHIDAVLRH